jgi:hypothetical protein
MTKPATEEVPSPPTVPVAEQVQKIENERTPEAQNGQNNAVTATRAAPIQPQERRMIEANPMKQETECKHNDGQGRGK